MSTVPRSVSSFTPESGGESEQPPPRLIDCSWPRCSAKALPRHPLCQAHQQDISFKKPDSASPSAPPPQPPRISPDRGRTHSLGNVKPNKLLPENDKDRPILRRKTAQRDPFMPIQPSSKQSTPSIPGDSFPLPLSPKQTFPRPPAHSPPESPSKPRDVEPVRKRQKVSHALNGASESRTNGTHALDSDKGAFDLKHKNAKVQSYASYGPSATRPGRGPETEKTEKNGFRLSSSTRPSPVRKMAPQNIRPLNGIGGISSSAEFAPPAAGANGFGPSGANTSNRTHNQTQSFQGNKGPHDYFAAKINQPANSPHFIQTTAATDRYAGDAPIDKQAGGRRAFEQHFQPSSTDSSFSREHWEQHIRPSQTNGIPRTQKQQPRPRETKPAEIIYPIAHKFRHVQPPKMIDEAAFDNLIYQQEGASTPPPGVVIPEPTTPAPAPKPEAPDEPVFANIDPRIHWTLPQSESWLRKKQEEIEARGGRKANFGKAAVRMKQQLQQDGPPSFEETLPAKILDNPGWVRALKKLETEAKEVSAPQSNPATATRRKPGPKPGSKRQLSNGSGPESARSAENELQAANRSG